ncbi:MAG: hypothetical protein M3153_04165 [Chloroflexota bacterium]|nr:hypothetical protein [Chloroflexota bacterium]
MGKSIGSLAIPMAAERGYLGVWCTPLLGRPTVAGVLERLPAPTLLIGTTRDPLGSIDALRAVVGAVDRFVAGLGGTGHSGP